MGKKNDVQRLPAEALFQKEIDALIQAEQDPVPTGWNMSPRSVLTYICGGKAGDMDISPKYIGNRRLVEIAISTLVTDRALLLIGEPGTAKSWLSEHLTAAINGDSTKVVQGTAGTTEEQIRWAIRNNYCRCTGYVKIVEAIRLAGKILREKKIPLPATTDWKIGSRVQRLDVEEKVLGTGKYPDDY